MSDQQEDQTTKPAFINANRRGFLQGAAVAGGVAATGAVAAADSIDVQAETPAAPTNGKGYELTDYVKKYYQRARS